MTIINFLTSFANIHEELAKTVYPHGARIACRKCGYSRIATVADCAGYLARGWPRHCGREMAVAEVKSDETE